MYGYLNGNESSIQEVLRSIVKPNCETNTHMFSRSNKSYTSVYLCLSAFQVNNIDAGEQGTASKLWYVLNPS